MGSSSYGGQQDKYRGSSYPGFYGGSVNSAGDYVTPNWGSVNPQPSTSDTVSNSNTSGLKNQSASPTTNALLSNAGGLASAALTGGKMLYGALSGGTTGALESGGALDAATSGATDAMLSGGTADAVGSGLEAGGGLLGSSAGASEGASLGAGIADSVGADAATSAAADTAASAGADALGSAATDEVGSSVLSDVGAAIWDALPEAAAVCVICTELLRQGKISNEDRMLDIKFMNEYLTPTHYDGYIAWAPKVVMMMRSKKLKGRIVTWIAFHIFAARQKEIKRIMGLDPCGSIFGRLLRAIGEPICLEIGRNKHLTTTLVGA